MLPCGALSIMSEHLQRCLPNARTNARNFQPEARLPDCSGCPSGPCLLRKVMTAVRDKESVPVKVRQAEEQRNLVESGS